MSAEENPLVSPIRLVAGLGNPGERYRRTRHNVGQRTVEELARRFGAGKERDRFAGRLWETRGPAGPVALLIPTTFMNLSGDSVGPAMGSLHLEPEQVLVLHDEMDLPFGTVRGKVGGGVGGNNGLRSLKDGLGRTDFLRIRLGVDRPPPEFQGDTAAWVLSGFAQPESEVEQMISRAADMAELALAEGIDAAIAKFHARGPAARRQAADSETEPAE